MHRSRYTCYYIDLLFIHLLYVLTVYLTLFLSVGGGVVKGSEEQLNAVSKW